MANFTKPKPTHPWRIGVELGWLCVCKRRNSYGLKHCEKCGKKRFVPSK